MPCHLHCVDSTADNKRKAVVRTAVDLIVSGFLSRFPCRGLPSVVAMIFFNLKVISYDKFVFAWLLLTEPSTSTIGCSCRRVVVCRSLLQMRFLNCSATIETPTPLVAMASQDTRGQHSLGRPER